MGKIAFVFSGQGAQYSGMGRSLYQCSPAAKQLFDSAEQYRPGTKEQCFSGSAEELKQTKNTQPCIYLTELSAALTLGELGIQADACAGFSLGEIAALSYGGAYSHEAGFQIVTLRGEAMQQAAAEHDTAMAAVMKLDSETVEKVCREFPHVYPVNYNSPVQTVISGAREELEQCKEKLSQLPCRVMDLPVSAAFHSPYMNSASESFGRVLQSFSIVSPKLPIYSNTTASPYEKDVTGLMTIQMKNPVRWVDTIHNMIADGVTDFIEVGPGKTLCGLIKKISPQVNLYHVEDETSLTETVKAVKERA